MPQAKKKQTTKTAAKRQARPAKKKTCTRTCCQQDNGREKMHIYIVTALSMITAILLCANVAIMVA